MKMMNSDDNFCYYFADPKKVLKKFITEF